MVDLPPPEGPTSATVRPAGMVKRPEALPKSLVVTSALAAVSPLASTRSTVTARSGAARSRCPASVRA